MTLKRHSFPSAPYLCATSSQSKQTKTFCHGQSRRNYDPRRSISGGQEAEGRDVKGASPGIIIQREIRITDTVAMILLNT